MLTIYDTTGQVLTKHDIAAAPSTETVWYDLVNPTKEEDNKVEALLSISVPTRAEMREIEASNRFYQETGAHYMTGFILHDSEEPNGQQPSPQGSNITFILTGHALVTVRYTDTKAFPLFMQRLERGDATCTTGAAIMIGLVESILSRQADLIERVQDKMDKVATGIFDLKGRRRGDKRLDVLLRASGHQGDTIARVQESGHSMQRLLHVFRNAATELGADAKILQRIDTATKDLQSLADHTRFLSDRISLLLNASLGLISTEQNQIIKLFSVMAVMLMPPTLVASVYGMNFRHMPELDWPFGYPMALGLMLLSAIIPYVYFRRKGWL